MQERRRHKRLPAISLAEPVEISVVEHGQHKAIPGIITNISAGGMDMVLMEEEIEGLPTIKLNMHLPGFDRFSVEGTVTWARPKGETSAVGIRFTKIDADHAKQIGHMADAYWECEQRIREKAKTVCFHGCHYWDLCEKEVKLKGHKKTH